MLLKSFLRQKARGRIRAITNIYRLLKYLKQVGSDRAIFLLNTIENEYGHLQSFKTQLPIDKDKLPLPWYTYPAIEYLNQLNFSNKFVFEYGSGNSSLFWSKRCHNITSVEHNEEWYKTVKSNQQSNQKLLLKTDKFNYVQSIGSDNHKYDVVIIDGIERFACAQLSIDYLNEGGLIILDNSDWFPETSKSLRSSGLIQVDFTGFGPINYYAWTTSMFFQGKFTFNPKFERQPVHGIGSLPQTAEEDISWNPK